MAYAEDSISIGALYDISGGNFNEQALNELAGVVGYDNIQSLISAVNDDENSNIKGTKNSHDFGMTTVELGSYTSPNGTVKNLQWFPVYLSKSASDDVVLTLWLSPVASVNGEDSSMQEYSAFSDGWNSTSQLYSETYSASVNGVNSFSGQLYDNAYDGSFMRHRTLNCDDNYLKQWGVNNLSETEKTAIEINYSKFMAFNSPAGYLRDYIVSPNEMGGESWQMTESSYRNDPAYAGADSQNFPAGWTNDKVWLPSVTELYCKSQGGNTPPYDGGVWGLDRNVIGSQNFWLRSASDSTFLHYSFISTNIYVDAIYYAPAVRPAIHLNLTEASKNMVHTHSFTHTAAKAKTCTSAGNIEYWYCSGCGNYYSDLQGNAQISADSITVSASHSLKYIAAVTATCTAAGNSEYWECSDCKKLYSDNNATTEITTGKPTIPANGHSYSESWTSDENDHWHAATCGHTTEKNGFAAHTWDSGTETKSAKCNEDGIKTYTCTVCSKTKTEPIAKTAHTPGIAASCTTAQTCTVCGVELVAALGHDFSITVSGTQPTCQQGGSAVMQCSRCTETETQTSSSPVAHSFTNYVSNNDATCTADGTKTAHCDFECGTEDTIADTGSATGHTAGTEATCTTAQTCDICGTELAPATGHTEVTDAAKAPTCTETGLTEGVHCSVCGEVLTAQEEMSAAGHSHEWVITRPATTEEAGLMQNICTVCGDIDGEEEIAKLIDPNGEIDLPVDINVEFKVTQSSTDNDYSNINEGLKRGYWAQLWCRNEDGTLGDEYTDKINCFLTLKIPVEIIEAIRGGDEINRDKIAAGLKVYYIDSEGAPVEIEKFEIAMRDDDSWQINFNYNEKFRAEVVFAADVEVQPTAEPKAGIPWWVWLIVGLVGVVIVIIVVVKKKNGGGDGGTTVIEGAQYDDAHIRAQLAAQDKKLDEIKEIVDGGFNDVVDGDDYK